MALSHDVAVLAKMAEELNDYLLSDVLFWPMQAGSNYPRLSLGLMLLTRARLDAGHAALNAEQRAERDKARRLIETTLSRWPVAAENKAAKELGTRLNLWRRFWDDCADNPAACGDHYAHEVNQRVIAELLLKEFPRIAETPEGKSVAAHDSTVRPRLKNSDFIWDRELKGGFPQSPFWYLYAKPR